jgi:hypothetical protein
MKGKLIAVLLALLFLAAGAQALSIKVNVDPEEFKEMAEAIVASPEMKDFLGEGPTIIKLMAGQKTHYVKIENGQITEDSSEVPLGNPDFTILVSRAAFLSLANASDKAEGLKRILAQKLIKIMAQDLFKQGLIEAAMASDLIKATPFGDGSQVNLGGVNVTVKSMERFQNVFRGRIENDDYVFNKFGSPIGALSRNHARFSNPPSRVPVFFNQPPGILAQNPGLIYDNVTQNTNLLTPRTVFQLNPGLVGPNQILANNPGLLGPADIGLLNPGLRGPAEFAYMMGIGAHSNTAQHMLNNNFVTNRLQNRLGTTNRWGQRGGLGGRP